jgi:hypothetical protein
MGAFNLVWDLVQQGGQGIAKRLLPQILSATEMAGGEVQRAGRQLAVDTGLLKPLDAFPSVVSRKGNNQGLLGVLNNPNNLQYRAPEPAWEGASPFPPNSRPTSLLPQPYQGPGFGGRSGALVPVSVQPKPAQKIAPVAEEIPLRPSRPAPASTSQVPEEFGGRLDLRNPPDTEALVPFKTGRGAVRPAGTKIGGQPYSGKPYATEANIEAARAAASPELNPKSFVREGRPVAGEELGRSMFLERDMTDPWNEYEIDPAIFESFVRMGRRQGPEAAQTVRAAFGAGAGPTPVDAAVDRAFALAQDLRNSAAGARTLDLSGIDPRALFALGSVASATALSAGLMMNNRGEEGSPAVGEVPTTAKAPEVDTTSVSSETSAVGQARVLFKENTGAPLGPIGSSPSEVPSSPNTIATTGDQRIVDTAALAQVDPGAAAFKRLMEPMSPERYKNIDDYYRDKNISEYYSDRDAYSNQPNIKRELMRYAGGTGSSPQMSADLEIWAQNFPGLAYELQRRALANQQSAEMAETPLY